jgi:hypothetical protein
MAAELPFINLTRRSEIIPAAAIMSSAHRNRRGGRIRVTDDSFVTIGTSVEVRAELQRQRRFLRQQERDTGTD